MSTRTGHHRLLLAFAAFTLLSTSLLTEGAEKVFVYGLEGEPESLDFAKASSLRAERVTWLLCDALINTSKDGRSLEPGLAESWTVSPDGLRVAIKLRAGASFHDGTSLDAVAVKASIERQFRPGHELYSTNPPNSKESMLTGLIEDIQVQDGLTLLFRLRYPGLHYLSEVEIVSPTALARLGKEFGRNPVCTGPFKFEGWTSERIVLTANDRYWAGRPRIDRVVFRIASEGKALAEALVRAEVDFLPVLPDPLFLERVRENPRIKLLPVPGLNVYYLGFISERPPFNNPLLRKAVAQGINVSRIMQFLGRGTAVAAKGPLAPAMKGYDPAVSQTPYDPQASREFLSKGGYESGRILRLVYNSAVTFSSEIAGAIQNDLRRVGITVELLGRPSFRDMVAAVRAREGDMFLYSWHIRAPYPERLLMPLFHSRSVGTSNLTHYRNPTVDRMLDEAVRVPEGPQQRRIYSQIQGLIVEDAPMLFLYHATRMAAYQDRVQGLDLKLDVAPHDKLVKVDLSP